MLRRVLFALAAFLVGFIGLYLLALVLGFMGFSTLPGLPYEQLLGWMVVAGVGCAGLSLLVRRRRP